MEQPWPPPGPWSLRRAEGEAEEESGLDISPGSPGCPQPPGGGAQVRGGLRSVGDGEVPSPGPPARRLCDPLLCPVQLSHLTLVA